jgi:error-prone DNA polymerase
VEQVWKVVAAFASFGFCKAHAAAFALPTYQSAWLKAHHTAAFLAGVLTHDPGMYPKRLLLDDARHFGIAVLGVDVDHSEATYTVVRLDDGDGIRVPLAEVKGITEAEVARIVAARPYASLTDFWQRAGVSRPVVEHLVVAGGFDRIHRIRDVGGSPGEPRGGQTRRGTVTRRDLLLLVADLDRHTRVLQRAGSARGVSGRRRAPAAASRLEQAVDRNSAGGSGPGRSGVWGRAAAQSLAPPPPAPVATGQLALDLGDGPVDLLHEGETSGLPEMDAAERVHAELEVLGLDTSRHVVELYDAFLDELGVVRSRDLLRPRRTDRPMLVAGVKVATQTPPIRSGRRVVFLTLDDSTGPVDLTFFEDALGPCATTVFHSWLLVARGELRRTGRRGVSLRATGCWDLTTLFEAWRAGGTAAVHALLDPTAEPASGAAGGQAPRKLWHSSPGSSGR